MHFVGLLLSICCSRKSAVHHTGAHCIDVTLATECSSWMSDEEIVCMFELTVGFFFIFSSAGKLDKGEFMFFLTGGAIVQNEIPNPDPSWLTKMMWDKICCLDSQPAFSGEIDECAYVEKLWGHVTDSICREVVGTCD